MSGLEWLFLVCFILAVHSESAENILVVNDQGGDIYIFAAIIEHLFWCRGLSQSVTESWVVEPKLPCIFAIEAFKGFPQFPRS